MPHPATVGLRRAASDDITDRRRHARSDRAAVAAEAGAAGLKPSAAATAAAAAATAAAAAAGRHLKHSQTYALGRASAPLRPGEGPAYDGHTRAAAGPGDAGISSSGRGGSMLAAAAAAAGSGGPTAAAVAANARAASLQHYSGLPMVQPPTGSSSAAAWLPDLEQQQQQLGVGGSSIGTGSTNLDTPKDPFWLSASVASASPRSSRAASPGPYSSTAHRCNSPAAVPAPAFTAGSYVGELPQYEPHEQQQQHQRTLLSSVLGGSAPVMPLAASLVDDADHPPCLRHAAHPSDSSDEEHGFSHAQEGSEGSPVSHARLQQVLQQHLHTQQQQQQQVQPLPHCPADQVQQEHPGVVAAWKGGHHRTGSTASAAAASVTTGPAESVVGGEEGKGAAEGLADVFVEVLRGEPAGRCGSML